MASPPSTRRGFTLIEVMVALAIIAFGLAAVFTQLNQSASAAARLRDRTFAHWIAMNQLTALRLADGFPAAGTRSDEVEMGNQRWHYQISVSATEDDGLRRVDVSVSLAGREQQVLASAVGFLAEPPPTAASGLPLAGWPLPQAGGSADASPAPATPAGNRAGRR